MKLEFKPEDFFEGNKPLEQYRSKQYADQANKLLPEIKESWKAEMLKDAKVVYGRTAKDSTKDVSFGSRQNDLDTHQALLINIEPIAKEPCKHKPHVRKFIHETTMFYTWVCECGIELVAEWKVK